MKETASRALEWIKLNSKNPAKCKTMLRLLETHSRLNKRKMKFIAEKLKIIKEKLKEKNGASVKEIYVANTEQQQRLPFLLGLINHSNKKAKNLDKYIYLYLFVLHIEPEMNIQNILKSELLQNFVPVEKLMNFA